MAEVGEIPDRLLTTGSDRGQLANTANRQMTAFAQQQASDAPAPDYRFARPDVAELTIELATKRSDRARSAPRRTIAFAQSRASGCRGPHDRSSSRGLASRDSFATKQSRAFGRARAAARLCLRPRGGALMQRR